MLGLDKTQVFWPGAVLTSVMDMFIDIDINIEDLFNVEYDKHQT